MTWKLHVATQVPAQLVGLAAACERRRSFGWCGSGSGPAGVLGKGLAGGPARVLPWCSSRPRQDNCRGSCGFPRLGSRQGSPSSGPHLISHVHDLDEDLHATTEVPPAPWFQCSCWQCFELLGSRVARSAGVGQAAPARLLLGPRRPPRQGSCRGSPPRPFALLCFWSWCCLGCLVPSASLLCLAQCGRGRGSDCPCTSKGVKRSAPTFVHRHSIS